MPVETLLNDNILPCDYCGNLCHASEMVHTMNGSFCSLDCASNWSIMVVNTDDPEGD